MSSGSSTERGRPGRESGFQLWHVFLILSMGGAIWVVVVSRHTHPAALLVISAAVMAAGLVGMALYYALSGFLGGSAMPDEASLPRRVREAMVQEKALVLRSIKELEFDRAMGKVSDADFAEIGGRLRERAMVLMEDLDRTREVRGGESKVRGPESEVRSSGSQAAASSPVARSLQPVACPACHTVADVDARFCKACGAKL